MDSLRATAHCADSHPFARYEDGTSRPVVWDSWWYLRRWQEQDNAPKPEWFEEGITENHSPQLLAV